MSVDHAALEAQVRRDCQFPPGERPEPYQDFYLPGAPGARRAGPLAGWVQGSRRVHARAEKLGFEPNFGDFVLDIGCQSGGFLQYAALRSAWGIGIDAEKPYLDCALALRDAVGHDLYYVQLDVTRLDAVEAIRGMFHPFPTPPDHLLLLSMEKHIGLPALLRLVDGFAARRTYLETNAYRAGTKGEIEAAILQRGGVYLGDSDDRNPRRLYRI